VNREKMACACKGVSYGRIIDAVNQGARSFEEVQKLTRCAAGCGHCREFIEHFVAELAAEKKTSEGEEKSHVLCQKGS